MTNTILTASAMDVQADFIYTEVLAGVVWEWDDREFAACISPIYTGTEYLGYFV